MRPIIHVVDDEPALRESLALLFESAGWLTWTYADAADFLARYRPEYPGCLILDLRLPGMDGLQLLEELQRRGLNLQVIMLTGHGDIPQAVQAIQSGALDFLSKPCDTDQLLECVQRALQRDLTERRRQRRLATAKARYDLLSPREREVLDGVVTGQPNRVIAETLGLSLATVESHRRHVMHKLRANSLADLVRLCESLRKN